MPSLIATGFKSMTFWWRHGCRVELYIQLVWRLKLSVSRPVCFIIDRTMVDKTTQTSCQKGPPEPSPYLATHVVLSPIGHFPRINTLLWVLLDTSLCLCLVANKVKRQSRSIRQFLLHTDFFAAASSFHNLCRRSQNSPWRVYEQQQRLSSSVCSQETCVNGMERSHSGGPIKLLLQKQPLKGKCFGCIVVPSFHDGMFCPLLALLFFWYLISFCYTTRPLRTMISQHTSICKFRGWLFNVLSWNVDALLFLLHSS
jgi:hypothetical protein